MKTKILSIVTVGMLTLGMTSCGNDFLEVSSKTEGTTGNFYSNEAAANRALIGCYDGWQRTVSNGPTFAFHYLSELLSDQCFGGTGANDARNSAVVDRFDMAEDNSQQNLHNTLWESYYAAIYRVNELLTRTEGVAWSSEKVQGQLLGEARAMRGILYFDLARVFENVPLITEPTTENVAQAPVDDVYAQIFEDLKFAAENIPADAYSKASSSTNDGRITCYAAKAMMARAYLFYTGVYGKEPAGVTKAQILADLEDIISSGEYDLIPLYKNLWYCASTTWEGSDQAGWKEVSTYAGEDNVENILTMKFNYTSDYNGNAGGNNAIQMFSIRGGTFKAPYGQGWGGATVPENVYNSYPNGDQRRDASIINLAGEGIESTDAYQKAILDQREYTGYFNKKYTARSGYHQSESDGSWSLTHYWDGLMAGDFQISQPIGYTLIRYADVLLMAAELGSSNAQDYLNRVHSRAYATENADGSVNTPKLSVALTRDNIMEERRLEFAFEGIRYWDLLRQGVNMAANAIVASGSKVLNGGIEATVNYSSQNIISKRGFQQIPQTQITLSNGVLKQNAGW
ncbi:MAG: RagB/SusD family nutrient uptake outer membrane protein [Prevotella sp.]|nr:RagB/SusD family nutrient uptake outer membrane protein [Prevotella sp.]